MITKGGLETITRHLAMEYAKDGIRVNAVAPGVVQTPMHRDMPKDEMEGLSPMGRPSTVKDIADAVMYLTEAETVTQHLAMEYAKDSIRVNAVAPGVVYTPMHRETPKDVMEGLSPMGRPSTVKDIADAVMYLTDAATVTGHILYVDGGAHFGRW